VPLLYQHTENSPPTSLASLSVAPVLVSSTWATTSRPAGYKILGVLPRARLAGQLIDAGPGVALVEREAGYKCVSTHLKT
jgi:hypothetical protein